MRFSVGALATSLLGLATAAAIGQRETCNVFTGEVIQLSLVYVQYPVVINSYINYNTIIIIDKGVTINVNNAPTYLTTTVSVTSTSTSTRTLSTATVTYTPPAVTVTASSVVAGTGGNISPARTSTAVPGSAFSNSATRGPRPTGEDAAGKGVNTALYTATTTTTRADALTTQTSLSVSSFTNTTVTSTAVSTAKASATSLPKGEYTKWSVFKGNGVNLGGWFELEPTNSPDFFLAHGNTTDTDEWNFCKALGSRCGPVMEQRYASFYTTATVDRLASVGVNLLRIPTSYQAWIDWPESELYHGNQQYYFQALANYAIETYGMRIILDIHSLPGGTNGFGHGEADGHNSWWFNETHLELSYQAVDAALAFIEASGNPWAYTIAAINEPSDNPQAFATPQGVSQKGRDWLVRYTKGVIARTTAVDPKIPVMFQDAFLGEETWSSYFDNSTNLVFDTHVYYFTADNVYPEYVHYDICGVGNYVAGDGKFPVFVGEWSLQLKYNNSFSYRESIFNTQRYSWSKFASGSSFWTANFTGDSVVNGEGTASDYWSYLKLIDADVIKAPATGNVTYC